MDAVGSVEEAVGMGEVAVAGTAAEVMLVAVMAEVAAGLPVTPTSRIVLTSLMRRQRIHRGPMSKRCIQTNVCLSNTRCG